MRHIALLLLSFATIACAVHTEGCPHEPVDSEPELPRLTPAGTFVIDQLDVARPSPTSEIIDGLNLDGRVSCALDREGAFIEDTISPSGVRGVDSRFYFVVGLAEIFLGPDLATAFEEQFVGGDVFVLDFERMRVATARIDDPALLTSGRLTPGQSFRLDQAFAFPPPTGGGFLTTLGDLPIVLPLGDGDGIPTVLHDAHLRVDNDPAESGKVQGLIAGHFLTTELIDALLAEPPFSEYPDLVRDSVLNQADLLPDDESGEARAVSVALLFHAISAELLE